MSHGDRDAYGREDAVLPAGWAPQGWFELIEAAAKVYDARAFPTFEARYTHTTFSGLSIQWLKTQAAASES